VQGFSRRFLLWFRFPSDRDRVLRAPAHQHLPALLDGRLGRCALRVLTNELKLPAALEGDGVAGDHARVGDPGDAAALGPQPVRRPRRVEQLDLLRPDREPRAVALEQVGDADEAGDELGRRALVELDRGADLLDPSWVT
jgi:hypothetical protein